MMTYDVCPRIVATEEWQRSTACQVSLGHEPVAKYMYTGRIYVWI